MSNKNIILKIVHSALVSLPAPVNISLWWNFGVILIVTLMIQIVSGLLLASGYTAGADTSHSSLSLMMEYSGNTWLTRFIHANGASLYFMALYMHVGRGIYYNSFVMKHTWNIGVTIMLLSMATAFIGYVLPFSQMSFWGASVITNLFSEIPYLGPDVVKFIWGGSFISNPTLTRFFTFHFILPFIILAFVLLHISFLHTTGSSNPLGINSIYYKIYFKPYFFIKDLFILFIILMLFMTLNLYFPLILGDDENFVSANYLVTPAHIQPEWYFLFAYAILRSVPNKLGGVIALAMSVIMLYSFPMTHFSKMKTNTYLSADKFFFWTFIVNVLLLTWVGAKPVEDPYILTGQLCSFYYFFYYMAKPMIFNLWSMSFSDK